MTKQLMCTVKSSDGSTPPPPADRQIIGGGGHIFIDSTVQISSFVTINIIRLLQCLPADWDLGSQAILK